MSTCKGNCTLTYIKNKQRKRLLPFQYYDEFNLITIPMKGKAPIIRNWPNAKETVPPSTSDLNTGILTGKINDITVLDIDVQDNGLALWKQISSRYSPINTPTAISPSGSIHMYFRYNSKIRTSNKIIVDNKKVGWDIRSDKGIIVAPPSRNVRGDKYKWKISMDQSKCVIMPKWLEDYILKHQVKLK